MISWSDHAPIAIRTSLTSVSNKPYHWRLDDALLREDSTKQELRTVLSQYFDLNTGSVPTESTLWEAHKAVVRGHCIAMTANRRHIRLEQQSKICKIVCSFWKVGSPHGPLEIF